MAKMIRIVADVAREKLADAMESLTDLGATVAVSSMNGAEPTIPHSDDDEPPVVERRTIRTASKSTGQGLRGRAVVYTPAGTKRQIDAALAKLRAGSLSAYVYRDLINHPGSSNAEVRSRLAKTATKIGASVESVDNIIWKQVSNGIVRKEAAEEV